MSRPCTVCAHLERAKIDQLLATQVCNVTQLGRTYGVSRDALRAHRQNHLPSFVPAFSAQADSPGERALEAERQRLYLSALDNLARAEAGVLQRIVHEDPETGERYVEQVAKVSITSVSRAIREARETLGELERLREGGRGGEPEGQTDAALGAAIRAQLERVVARRTEHADDRAAQLEAGTVDAEVVEVDGIEVGDSDDSRHEPRHRHPGTQAGQHGGTLPSPPLPRDAVASLANPVGGQGNPTDLTVDENGDVQLSIAQVAAAARAAGVTPESLMSFLRQKTVPKVQHPEWTGNPAASKEERAAAGYADIPIQDHRYDEP